MQPCLSYNPTSLGACWAPCILVIHFTYSRWCGFDIQLLEGKGRKERVKGILPWVSVLDFDLGKHNLIKWCEIIVPSKIYDTKLTVFSVLVDRWWYCKKRRKITKHCLKVTFSLFRIFRLFTRAENNVINIGNTPIGMLTSSLYVSHITSYARLMESKYIFENAKTSSSHYESNSSLSLTDKPTQMPRSHFQKLWLI